MDRKRALLAAALAITSELSLDVVLDKIVNVAKDLVSARYAALGVAREDRKSLSRFIVSGVTDEQIEAIGHWPRGLGILGVLLQDPQPLRLRNIHHDARSIGFPPGHPPMTSFLGVPIMARGRILGNFYLTDKIGAEEFDREDEDLIVGLAAFAAVAIENARLYTQTNVHLRHKIEEVEKAEQHLRFLVELSALLPSGPILEELPLEDVMAKTTALLGDGCGVYLAAPDCRITRKCVVHRDPARAEAAQDLVEASWDTICDQVLKKDKSVFAADVTAIPAAYTSFSPDEMRERRFSAAMALPVKSAKHVYGVFFSLASQPLRFTQEDLSFGMLIAQRLGTAVENSLLLRQLVNALKARDEFTSIATHELKTPVTILAGYADIALRSLETKPQQARLAVETIKKQADRLAALADELLDAARISSGSLKLHQERLNFPAVLSEAVERFRVQLTAEDNARLKLLTPAIELWGDWDAMRLEQVLVNLLSNAFKYSPRGGDVEVSVERLGQEARIAVRDRGMGIPEDQRVRVFEPFFRSTVAAQAKVGGAGLGLHISKEIIEHHGGKMWFESEENKGSAFYFTLPLG